MQDTPEPIKKKSWTRHFGVRARVLGKLILWCVPGVLIGGYGVELAQGGNIGSYFVGIADMWLDGTPERRIERHVDPTDPQIMEIADGIRSLTRNPVNQAAMVAWVVTNRVDYTRNEDLWPDRYFVPTLAQLEADRLAHGWDHWRGDCKTIALVQCSVLKALGFDPQVESNRVKRHAWTMVRVAGMRYALNDDENTLPSLPRSAALNATFLSDFAKPEKRRALQAVGYLNEKGKLDSSREISTEPPIKRVPLIVGTTAGLLWCVAGFGVMQREDLRRGPEAPVSPTDKSAA